MEKDITINELARMVNRGFEDLRGEMKCEFTIVKSEIANLKEDINDLQVYKANYVSRFEFQRLENRVEVLENGE